MSILRNEWTEEIIIGFRSLELQCDLNKIIHLLRVKSRFSFSSHRLCLSVCSSLGQDPTWKPIKWNGYKNTKPLWRHLWQSELRKKKYTSSEVIDLSTHNVHRHEVADSSSVIDPSPHASPFVNSSEWQFWATMCKLLIHSLIDKWLTLSMNSKWIDKWRFLFWDPTFFTLVNPQTTLRG